MMSIQSARETTQAVSGMAINRRGIEVFAWAWGGGTCLMAGAGHVTVGGPSDRQRPRAPHPARGEVAPARHGLRDRLSEPAQIMRRPDSRLCVRFGRRKVELARRHAQTYDLSPEIGGDTGGKNFFG